MAKLDSHVLTARKLADLFERVGIVVNSKRRTVGVQQYLDAVKSPAPSVLDWAKVAAR